MGGVETGRDALELIACGATAVALGTVLFADPDAPARVRAELDEELRARPASSVRERCLRLPRSRARCQITAN